MNIVLPEIAEIQEEIIHIRHQIHENPEIGFEEHATSDLVANLMKSWGVEVTRGIGITGVVGQIKNGEGPTVGLRADMDALPITEETELPYSSKVKGKMHACGHDGHTATLLAAARYFSEHRNFKGTINFIFQPAEEGWGGASKMIEDGLFEKFPCDAIFGFHNMPGFETGKIGIRSGAAMASSDNVTITVRGKGGHGALPHLSVDPVVVASSIVMAMQTIISRSLNPLEMAIITVGSFHAGEANNVIPHEAKLELSVRTLNPEVQEMVETKIKEVVEMQAKSYGAEAIVDYQRLYPVLENDEKETEFVKSIAIDLFGEDQLISNFPQITASEDFSFMLQKVKGTYLFVGNGLEGKNGCSVHNPKYDFNDEIIPIVASLWVKLVEKYLQ